MAARYSIDNNFNKGRNCNNIKKSKGIKCCKTHQQQFLHQMSRILPLVLLLALQASSQPIQPHQQQLLQQNGGFPLDEVQMADALLDAWVDAEGINRNIPDDSDQLQRERSNDQLRLRLKDDSIGRQLFSLLPISKPLQNNNIDDNNNNNNMDVNNFNNDFGFNDNSARSRFFGKRNGGPDVTSHKTKSRRPVRRNGREGGTGNAGSSGSVSESVDSAHGLQDLAQIRRAIAAWDAKIKWFADKFIDHPEVLRSNPVWIKLVRIRNTLMQLAAAEEIRQAGLDETRM